MGALGHYLEAAGIPTTQISLVREHTEALRPPRALWVPFMLGRPFGVPNDPAFQRKVLHAALALLECEQGPVLEDFAEDAPFDDLGPEPQGLVCPVAFPRLGNEGSIAARLRDEVGQLDVWYRLAVKRRGRTTLGTIGLAPDALAEFVGAWAADGAAQSFRADLAPAAALKLACDELKAFYYEAKSAQPGRHSSAEFQRWFWTETAAGRTFLAIRERARASDDPAMAGIANLSLVPRAVDALMQNATQSR